MYRAVIILSFLCFAFTFVRPAAANTAVAEALFEDGRRLRDEGKLDEACAKFAESQRLDPGTGTLLNLAICYEEAGRLASAWATWLEAAASAKAAGQPDREAHARVQATNLKSKLATLSIVVDSETRPEGLVIIRGGEEQNPAVWGTAVPVDAGSYRVEARAPGYRTWSRDVTLIDGQSRTLTIPALEAASDAPAAQVAPIAAVTSGEQQDQPEQGDAAEKGSGLKTWSYILGGVGLAGLTVGSIFGVKAIMTNEKSYDYCEPSNRNECDETGVDKREQAEQDALVSTIFIGVGAAALATGVVLYLVAPSKQTVVAIEPRASGATLSYSGSF